MGTRQISVPRHACRTIALLALSLLLSACASSRPSAVQPSTPAASAASSATAPAPRTAAAGSAATAAPQPPPESTQRRVLKDVGFNADGVVQISYFPSSTGARDYAFYQQALKEAVVCESAGLRDEQCLIAFSVIWRILGFYETFHSGILPGSEPCADEQEAAEWLKGHFYLSFVGGQGDLTVFPRFMTELTGLPFPDSLKSGKFCELSRPSGPLRESWYLEQINSASPATLSRPEGPRTYQEYLDIFERYRSCARSKYDLNCQAIQISAADVLRQYTIFDSMCQVPGQMPGMLPKLAKQPKNRIAFYTAFRVHPDALSADIFCRAVRPPAGFDYNAWVAKYPELPRQIYAIDWDGKDTERLATPVAGNLPAASDTYLYWLNRSTNTLQRANINGGEVEQVARVGKDAVHAAVDLHSQRVFWATGNLSTRLYSSPFGEGQPTLLICPLRSDNCPQLHSRFDSAAGLFVDPVGQRLYWANVGSIQRAALDGSGIETVYKAELRIADGTITDLAFEPEARKIYWAVPRAGDRWIDNELEMITTLYRADLDGGNLEELGTTSVQPHTLAVDPQAGAIYLVGATTISRASKHQIFRFSLADRSTTGLPFEVHSIRGLAVDPRGGRLYWSDGNTLFDSALDGRGVRAIAEVPKASTSGVTVVGVGATPARP